MWKHKTKWLVRGGRKVKCYLCGKKILAKGDLFLFHGDTGYYSHQSCLTESSTISGNERRRAVKKIAVGAAVVGAIAAGAGKFLDVSPQSKNSSAAQTILTSQGLILPALTSDPANPVPGQMWYRSDAGVEAHFDGVQNRVVYSSEINDGNVHVTSKGIINGLSVLPNDGTGGFGPDTTKGATAPGQYGSPYTQTVGIMEMINSAPTRYNQASGRTVPFVNAKFMDGVYNITSPIVIYDDYFLNWEGSLSPIDDLFAAGYPDNYYAGIVIQSSSNQGNFAVKRNPNQLSSQTTAAGGGHIQISNISFQQTVQITNPVDSNAVFSCFGPFPLNVPFNSTTGPHYNTSSLIQIPTPDIVSFNNVSFNDLSGYNGALALFSNFSDVLYEFKGYIRCGSNNAQYANSVLSLGANQFQSTARIEVTVNAPSTMPTIDTSAYVAAVHIMPADNWVLLDLDLLGVVSAHIFVESGSTSVPVTLYNLTTELSPPVIDGATITPSLNGTYYGIFDTGVPLIIYRTNFGVGNWNIFTGFNNPNSTTYGPAIQNINGVVLRNFNAILAYWKYVPGNYNDIGLPIPSLPANPPVSGTVYQNTNPYDIEIDLPVYATTSGTAGYVTVAKGSTDTPTAIGNQFVNGSTSSTSVDIVKLRVPTGWYYEFTASGVTFGTASVFADD
jgi:hypothetical protein